MDTPQWPSLWKIRRQLEVRLNAVFGDNDITEDPRADVIIGILTGYCFACGTPIDADIDDDGLCNDCRRRRLWLLN